MKSIIIILISTTLFCGQSIAQKIGSSNTTYNTDMRTGEFSDFSFAGFSAEIQHIEFLPDSLAEVFMSYAVYGSEDGFNIKLLSAGDSTTFQEWNFDENKKTGIITFYVKQNVSNNFIFDLKIKARSSWRYQEKFSFSSMKQSAIALPIEEKNNPY